MKRKKTKRPIRAITTCSVDIIQDQQGRFYVCEFNQGLQSGGDPELWTHIVKEDYADIFPGAFIDDTEKVRFDQRYFRGYGVKDKSKLTDGRIGLVIFRNFLDAKKEFELRRRYRKYHPIIADPLSVRAIYMDKAYAAALDEGGLFPKSVILTATEIRNGALLDHFSPEERIVIKCPLHEQTKGMTLAYAGDVNIPLSEENESPFFLIQPAITTKGYTCVTEERDLHYNTSVRVYLTVARDFKGKMYSWMYGTGHIHINMAFFPSSSDKPEAVFLNRNFDDEPERKFSENGIPRSVLLDEDALRTYVKDRVIPFMEQIMSQPFDRVVKQKFHRARKANDVLRERALWYLLNQYGRYFSLNEDPSIQRKIVNQFYKASVIAGQPFASAKKHWSKILAPLLPRTFKQKHATDSLNEATSDDEFVMRQVLGLRL